MRPRAAAVLAVVVSIALIAAGPSIGELRSWIRSAFPGWLGAIVNTLLAGLVALLFVAALRRIRERRALRFGLMAAAIALASLSAVGLASTSASQNAVERFHFVEYGLVTWLWYRVVRAASPGIADPSVFAAPALAALVVGAGDEAMQWFVPERVGEYRDIFLNATAIGAGLLWSAGLDLPAPFTWRLAPPARRRIAIAGAAAIVAIAAFVHMAQLGTRVQDDEMHAAFLSRYSAGDLLALSRERAARWAVDPPPTVTPRYAPEDQYVTEAQWHIRARNEAWASAARTAWAENLILERYFAPVLDTPAYGVGISRWPDEQRRDAETRRGAEDARGATGGAEAPRVFISHANPLEIHTFSARWLWGTVLVVILALGLWSSREP